MVIIIIITIIIIIINIIIIDIINTVTWPDFVYTHDPETRAVTPDRLYTKKMRGPVGG